MARALEFALPRVRGQQIHYSEALIDTYVVSAGLILGVAVATASLVDRNKLRPYLIDRWHRPLQAVVFAVISVASIVAPVLLGISLPISRIGIVFTMLLLLALVGTWFTYELTRWPFVGLFFRFAVVLFVLIGGVLALVVTGPAVSDAWANLVGLPDKSVGLPATTLALGISATWALNTLLSREAATAIEHRSSRVSHLRRLLFRSLYDELPIFATCEDGKVYVGIVVSFPAAERDADDYFVLLPLSSGYRRSESRQLVLDTHYARLYTEIINASRSKHSRDERAAAAEARSRIIKFSRVIPCGKVQTVGEFDQKQYHLAQLSPQARADA